VWGLVHVDQEETRLKYKTICMGSSTITNSLIVC